MKEELKSKYTPPLACLIRVETRQFIAQSATQKSPGLTDLDAREVYDEDF